MLGQNQIKIYEVSEISTRIKSDIKADKTLQEVFVRGEVSNFSVVQGNAYFDIKDRVSKLHVVMFSVKKEVEEIKEGCTIIVHGKVDFYVKEGRVNLIADNFYVGGAGEIYLMLEQLKEKLRAEGLFAIEKKRPIPQYIFRVGIATSIQGAVIHDILHALSSAKGLEIYIVDTLVQGENAKESIVHALDILNCVQPDVIILARGGGSIEELWAFNEEIVVRAIRNSKVPVITAIGHETDRTLADLASDMSAPTPTYAGKFVYERYMNAIQKVMESTKKLHETAVEYVHEYTTTLDFLASKLSKNELWRSVQMQISHTNILRKSLNNAVLAALTSKKMMLEKLTISLEALLPEHILKLGYAYITKDGKIVISGKELEIGNSIEINFVDAVIDAKVEGKEVKEWKLEKVSRKN